VAEALDDDPFQLFALRGRSREALLAELRAARRAAGVGRGDGASPDGSGDPDREPSELDALVASAPPPGAPDPGEPAREAWARERTPLPPPLEVPAHPGAPAAWPADPPPGAPFDTPGLLALVSDAAQRALDQLRGDADSGLRLGREADLARRSASGLDLDRPHPVATDRDGRPRGDLTHRALAWRHGGEAGLAVLAEAPWRPPLATMAAARAAVEGAGVSPSVLTVNNNRITGPGFQLRLARTGSWWRFEKHRGRWEITAPPADAPDDLLGPSGA
jgi:hypothetical protein